MYKRAIVLSIIIGFFCGGLYFKGLTFNAIKGIINIEGRDKNIYVSNYYYMTKIKNGEKVIEEYLNNNGFQLEEKDGATYNFSNNRGEKLVLVKSDIFKKYSTWKGELYIGNF